MSQVKKHRTGQTPPRLGRVSLFLRLLLARAGEGGGKASRVDIEGASFSIFWLITPESVSNLNMTMLNNNFQ